MLKVAAVKQRGSFRLDASFELPTPGVVALFGRSGSGKSTLINVIAGLLAPESGHVSVDDAVVLDTRQRIDLPPERRRMGYVFQDARLFPHLSVSGNLRYAARRAPAAFVTQDTVVELLALAPLLNRRPHQLSGGERQRVAIGRALLSQPKVLLLDEPLASLDEARREEVLPYLQSLRDQLSLPMVYVSHDFREVLRLATHLVVMDGGKTIAQGEVAQMSLHPALRAIIGADAVGAIIDGSVIGIDESSGLTRVRIGAGELNMACPPLARGRGLRVQLLARDIIIATAAPQGLSVRNVLQGTIVRVAADDADADLVWIDVGGDTVISRVTKSATRELALRADMRVWALVKSVSLRGYGF